MGWHDVHMRVEGIAARDVARNFIERWNYAKIDLERISTPFLVPKTTISAAVNEGTLQVQVLRSLGGWHLPNFTGCPERSIYKAYLHHISHAKHFIYIGMPGNAIAQFLFVYTLLILLHSQRINTSFHRWQVSLSGTKSERPYSTAFDKLFCKKRYSALL
jgi:phosphatidylserine/phosphatidylglycerophosphate/cardiolipin synthase-like enzyme